MSRRIFGLLIGLLVTACASGGSYEPRGETAKSSNRDVLTAAEIATIQVTTAYDAVVRLRPEFLRSRGPDSIMNQGPDTPLVYQNGVRLGTIEMLRQFRANEVSEIRYLSPSDATTRYGTGHTSGVIEVRIGSAR